MTYHWKKLAMIMLAGLLLVGPFASHHAVAQGGPGVDKAINDALAANNKAVQMWGDTNTKMNSMKSMPMNANEKSMMSMMQQMMDTMKSLADANKATLDALTELRKMQK